MKNPEVLNIKKKLHSVLLAMTVTTLTHNLCLRGGSARFFKKRALRILPPFYVAFLLFFGIWMLSVDSETASHQAFHSTFIGSILFSNLFLVHNILGNTLLPSNGVLWSVGIEWQIYLLFPTLLIAWKRLVSIKTILNAVIN